MKYQRGVLSLAASRVRSSDSLGNLSLDEKLSNHLRLDRKFAESDKSLDQISEDISASSEVSYCSSSSVSGSETLSNTGSSCGYGSLRIGVSPSIPGSRSTTPRLKSLFKNNKHCEDECENTINCSSPISNTSSNTSVKQWSCTWDSLLDISEDNNSFKIRRPLFVSNILSHMPLYSLLKKILFSFVRINSVITPTMVRPMSSLEKDILLTPKVALPIRRYNSEINLNSIVKKNFTLNTLIQRRNSLNNLDDCSKYERLDDIDIKLNNENKIYNNIDKSLSFCGSFNKFSEKNARKSLNSSQSSLSAKAKAVLLVKKLKLNNPVSVAMQLTAIDKDLYLQLRSSEIVHLLISKQKQLEVSNLEGVKTILEFAEKIKSLVYLVITRETTPESQARKIAAFIEVSCVLRKLRNWHSLNVVIKALQSPMIYFMESAWIQTKSLYPIHFNDYLKLSSFLDSCDHRILRQFTGNPSIPYLQSWIKYLQIQCSAKADLCQLQRKGFDAPSLAGWIEQETAQFYKSQKTKEEPLTIASLEPNKDTLIVDDPVSLISPASLPKTWTNCDLRNLPCSLKRTLTSYIVNAFNRDIKSVGKFRMRRAVSSI